jgi:hypothetical protein
MLLDAVSFAFGGAFGTVVGYLLFVIMSREVLTRAMPFKDCSIESCSKSCVWWENCNDVWADGKPWK